MTRGVDLRRQPPGGTEAGVAHERAVLGCVLRDNATLDALDLRPEDFRVPGHVAIYQAMLALRERGEPFDEKLLAGELERRGVPERVGGLAVLAELGDTVPSAALGPWYAEQVRDASVRRGIVVACDEIQKLACEAGLTAAQVADAARGKLEAAARGAAGRSGWKPVLLRLSDVEAEPVSWLWEPYVPRGMLTLLEGDPGGGKTWVALAIAAALSRGAALPGSAVRRPPATTLYLTNENAPEFVMRPRLDMLGADPSRVVMLQGKKAGSKVGSVSLQDVEVLGAALDEIKPDLLVIDPVQSFLGEGVDANQAAEVRPVLDRLVGLVRERGVAAVMIRHLAKAGSGRALHRGLGSIDFSACARSVLLAGETAEGHGPKRRALAHVKPSVGPAGPSQGYTLVPGEGFAWIGESEVTAHDLVAPDRTDDGQDRSALDDACDLLRDLLKAGPIEAKVVERELREAGVSKRTGERARKELGVAPRRVKDPQGRTKHWTWSLPTHTASQDSRPPHTPVGGVAVWTSNPLAAWAEPHRQVDEFGGVETYPDEEGRDGH